MTFRHIFFILAFMILCVATTPRQVSAQVVRPVQPSIAPSIAPSVAPTASPDPSATPSATPRVLAPAVDITQNSGETRSSLQTYLDQHPLNSTSPLLFTQRAIRNAVEQGVPPNIIVLLLLFPVTASLIAIFRHIIGLRGFGVYTPAVLAVAFISTGITRGLIIFTIILITTIIGRAFVARLKLQYLPRAALLLWLVCLVFFGLVLMSPFIQIADFVSLGIFPLLVLILLSENFSEAQLTASLRGVLQLTFETILLAVASTLFMRTPFVQQFVILHPEIIILSVLVINILVGRYTGLRVTEILRFKPILSPEE